MTTGTSFTEASRVCCPTVPATAALLIPLPCCVLPLRAAGLGNHGQLLTDARSASLTHEGENGNAERINVLPAVYAPAPDGGVFGILRNPRSVKIANAGNASGAFDYVAVCHVNDDAKADCMTAATDEKAAFTFDETSEPCKILAGPESA